MGEYQDYYLKITDIKGESKDDKHAGEIELESFSWGASNMGTQSSGGGGGAGKASFQDLHCVSPVSEASAQLFLSCANGKHHAEATLVCRKSGEEKLEYMTYKLKDVLITSYQTGGSGGSPIMMDQYSLNYAEISLEYKVQDEKGKGKGSGVVGWNLKKNVKV